MSRLSNCYSILITTGPACVGDVTDPNQYKHTNWQQGQFHTNSFSYFDEFYYKYLCVSAGCSVAGLAGFLV